MPLTGLFIESVDILSYEFQQCQDHFTDSELVRLYQIYYTNKSVSGLDLDPKDWREEEFFHGTGHCGCLARRILIAQEEEAGVPFRSREWCGSPSCSIQGILNHGFLDGKIRRNRAHFLSMCTLVAQAAALEKSPSSNMSAGGTRLFPIFICRIREVRDCRPWHQCVRRQEVK
ncbi:hypothetical protein BGX23_003969 [Mortierella sp. AD031]|nr:hypothetical protein BGX23_003969 [Mortierella sp. AD031]KAG0216896.1 hypothetical protein BGX33_011926 [Mortierella sp. NVP41]